MRNSISALMAAAVIIVTSLGCSKLGVPGKVNLFEGDNAAKAAAMIKEKVGSEQVKVIRAEIRKDTMEITIQSPKNPKDMDTYKFEKGVVSGPVPVQVMSIGNLEMSGEKYDTTDISEIGFAAIPETIKQAISLSNLENARVDLISMDGQRPETGNPQLKEDRKKELDALDKEFKEKQAACYKAPKPAVCLMDIFPLYQKAQDLRSGNPTDKNKFVLTWRLFVEGPRGRKDFWADKSGKLNEKSF